jgi:protein TonB
MRKKSLNNSSFDDAVFEGRNKDYGAYELRSRYRKRLLSAFFIAVLIVLTIIFFPKQEAKPEPKYTVDEVTLTPFKKIKQPALPEKQVEQKVVEKKTNEIPKPTPEKPKANETKIVVVEKKNTTQEVEPNKNDKDLPKEDSGNNSNLKTTADNVDLGPADSESITVPAIFPGCEKSKNRIQILECFNKRLNSEIQFYLENENWRRKSIEKIYFEIDREGNITNIKFDGGNKINDQLALETFKKIAMDYNKRSNPNRRIKPGKDALGKIVTIRYRIPVVLSDPNFD